MFTNAINKKNPTGRPIPLRRRTSMSIVIGSGNKRQVFDRPLDDEGREHIAEVLKAYLFRPALLTAPGVKL